MAGVLARGPPTATLRLACTHRWPALRCIVTVTCGVVTARRYQQPLAAAKPQRRRRIILPLCDGESLRSGKLRERDASTEADARAVRVRALHRVLPDVLDSR